MLVFRQPKTNRNKISIGCHTTQPNKNRNGRAHTINLSHHQHNKIMIIFLVEMVTNYDIKSKNQQYRYSEVVRITNNFQSIIGEGGFGKVYFGTLKDETQVAVKLLSPSSKQGYKEFRAEAQVLIIVHHRNLVSLIGYCDQGENKALIYEYMANGNLYQHLSVTNTKVLNWNERLQIAVDAAHGLEYLHNGCRPPIIHRDLKTTNILLNESMQAKIADFGMSRAFVTENVSHVSTRPVGTLGYLDPEFQSSGNLNKKSDVYSFGVVLFELITGRPAIIRCPGKNILMLDWVHPIIQKGDIQSIMDPRLEGEFNINTDSHVMHTTSCNPKARHESCIGRIEGMFGTRNGSWRNSNDCDRCQQDNFNQFIPNLLL